MSYIIKNTAGLLNTRLTDVGRRKLSQGDFNISYFQIGDSEVSYKAVPNYNLTNNNILMPSFNAQNDTGSPQSNKENIKYPYYVEGGRGNTYGIPYMDSDFQVVYNSAGEKGFFMTGGTSGSWTAQTSSAYTITSNYWVEQSSLTGQTSIDIELDLAAVQATTGTPAIGDFVTLILGEGLTGFVGNYPVFTYKIQNINPLTGTSGTSLWSLTLDRSVPNLSAFTLSGEYARVLIYPSGMTALYDTITPAPYWQTDTLNFESPCDVINRENTLIWNMSIPWSVSPAGVFSNSYEDYTKYGSISYIGTKEYLGYQEPTGQTDTSQVYYYNSFDEKVVVRPQDQKAIAIIHYTNQDIDNVYGEKFSTVPYDPQNPTDSTGLARHLKVTIPTLMWHKSTGNTIGQTFFIDPPGYDLCKPYYVKSTKNLDMNDPGIRYFHLWDTNPDDNGNLNRIGKVFPDSQTIIIDDEEVVASMSYKANRNWTLPAPKLSYLAPNTCFSNNPTATGLLTADTQTLWVTYRFNNTAFTESLHCNYYSKIAGPSTGCTDTSQNVAVRFGPEFQFLSQPSSSSTAVDLTGYCANSLMLLCQITSGDTQPSPTNWKYIDVTNDISSSFVNGYITMSGLTGTTLQIDLATYQSAVTNNDIYNLADYIDIPTNNQSNYLNFGDEYYFYGNFTTDISATIYEMRYLINLGRNQFSNTSNPTWTSGTTSYVTEIGLFNNNKDLIVISKLQSPQLRQGIQQFVISLDF